MPRAVARPYLVAVGASTAALALTLVLWPEIEPTPSPLFFAAIVYSSWYGGLGPALLATAFATAATAWFVPPVNSLAVESASDVLRLVLFALVALLTSSLYRARRRAESERGHHAALAGLGQLALAGGETGTLFREAATRLALTVPCERVTIWESTPDGQTVLRADVGCHAGIVEHAAVENGGAAALGNGLVSGTFRVPMPGADGPLGLVVLHTRRPSLHTDDRYFIQSIAHVLGEAVARGRAEQERSRLLVAERAARASAEAANRARQALLAVVCHELRAPLQSLVVWSRVLRHEANDGETTKTAADAIERTADTLNRLTADLLDEFRLAAGKLELRRRVLDLAEPISAALELMRAAADAKHIGIAPWIDPAPLPVFGDAMRLQQVVWNLIGNAVKFTPEGGRIEVAVRATGTAAEIAVSDTGPGIPAQLLPHVFEPFWQAGHGDHEGLGLGLAIVRQLVELHGGDVHVESGTGRGTTVRVSLPLLVDSPTRDSVQLLAGAPS